MILLLLMLLAVPQAIVVVPTGGAQYVVATMNYQFDFAVEGTWCGPLGRAGSLTANCVDQVELILTGDGQGYTVVHSFNPRPTSGSVFQGAYQFWGPVEGKPHGRRVYWVALVKCGARGQRLMKVLETIAVHSEKN